MDVIINADDFGQSDNVNSTILSLHKHGIVSSTTLIANGKAFKRAVEISKDNPKLGVGVHLCIDGPFNIGVDYKTIVNKTTNEFYTNYQIINKIKSFSINKQELFKEYCLQVEKVLDNGILVSHLDHHHHMHLYFPILGSIIKVARKYKIPHIRSQKILLNRNRSCLNQWYRNFHQWYLSQRINTTEGYFDPEIRQGPDMENNLARINTLLGMHKEIIEIVVHPKEQDDPETEFFMSNEVKKILKPHRIINYNDLII